MRPAALVFDFDGTIYRGNAPYLYYGERIAEGMAPHEREAYLALLREERKKKEEKKKKKKER